MRAVLDTSVFVAAVRSSDGAAAEILKLVFQRRIVILMDLKLGCEYRDVALRTKHVAASNFNKTEILELIEVLEAASETVKITTKVRPLSPDPNDDMILDLAINGHADALVTNNIKHFIGAAGRFEIPVLSPAAFLQVVRKGEQRGN